MKHPEVYIKNTSKTSKLGYVPFRQRIQHLIDAGLYTKLLRTAMDTKAGYVGTVDESQAAEVIPLSADITDLYVRGYEARERLIERQKQATANLKALKERGEAASKEAKPTKEEIPISTVEVTEPGA